jgi:2-aminobenzoate-CoA ligase
MRSFAILFAVAVHFVSTTVQADQPNELHRIGVLNEAWSENHPAVEGLMAMRGPTGCRYLDDVERQQAFAKDGWNYPGDVYEMTEDRYFRYIARADDMIISSGHNISGPEVEAALLDHPAVAECAVIGAPDADRTNIVKGFVVLRERDAADEATARALQDFVKAEIAPYKYPRAIEFVTDLPKTETGKLQRFRLRRQEVEKAEGA